MMKPIAAAIMLASCMPQPPAHVKRAETTSAAPPTIIIVNVPGLPAPMSTSAPPVPVALPPVNPLEDTTPVLTPAKLPLPATTVPLTYPPSPETDQRLWELEQKVRELQEKRQ